MHSISRVLRRSTRSSICQRRHRLSTTTTVLENAAYIKDDSQAFKNAIPQASWASNSQTQLPRNFLKQKTNTQEEEWLKSLATQDLEMQDHEDDLENGEMTPEVAEQWLESYTIPPEAFDDCLSLEDEQKVRIRYAKQLRFECSVHDLALQKYADVRGNVVSDLREGSRLKASQTMLSKWFAPMVEAIKAEQKLVGDRVREDGIDRMAYGPALLLLKPQTIAVIAINQTLNNTLAEAIGCKFVKTALTLGRAIEQELLHQRRVKDNNALWRQIANNLKKDLIGQKAEVMFQTAGDWEMRVILKLGAAVLQMVVDTCKVNPLSKDKRASQPLPQYNVDADNVDDICGDDDDRVPAFEHVYVQQDKKRRIGMIRCSEDVYKHIVNQNGSKNMLPYTARYLPMLVKPRPWTSVFDGGYLRLQTSVVRHRDSSWQLKCIRQGELSAVFEALNTLSEVPWMINEEVYHVMKKLWVAGGNFGDLPSRQDISPPDEQNFDMDDEESAKAYRRLKFKVERKNRELHSLRCDTVYKMQVADEFLKEDEIYFPYNMDFRGRVYPIPPNLNHLGSDLCRSLLIFKDAKPLGPNGLRWLKIHLANLFGVDKCSFDDREKFIDENIEAVLDSASNPLDGEGWWQKADYPFLALGVCFDLKRAIESPNPELYMSQIPVHQDGSCNGLQHYAALGRDQPGGFQVNLVPSDKPQDVYSGVADRVILKMKEDAEIEVGEPIEKPQYPREKEQAYKAALAEFKAGNGGDSNPDLIAMKVELDELMREYTKKMKGYKVYYRNKCKKKYANLLLQHISRPVVKQTVMTSVYGVTYVGARKQIQARLEEFMLTDAQRLNTEWENDVYEAACYAAEVTMASMGNLFNSARNIMDWLSTCARIVADEGQAMSWLTPLGLPVVQPYRRPGTLQIRTKMQHVIVSLTDSLPVSAGRQKSAFPPNFVHSLDSTHMMMTALKCRDANITFAAVHDSYWSHACTVDTMNTFLREEFINLYQQPLLEELLQQLQMRFPKADFPPIPELGELDITQVADSPYFFN